MITISREWLQQTIAELEEERDATPGAVNEDAAMALVAMKLAMASLEAEPVAYMYKDNLHSDARFSLHTRFGNWSQEDINEYEITEIPLYAAPPAAVSVPEWTNEQCLEFLSIAFRHAEIKGDLELDDIRLGVKMVNGSRAAMLQGAEHVTTAYKLPEGWVAVPVDATRAMIDAARRVEEDGYDAMHKAMIAAAPQQEVK